MGLEKRKKTQNNASTGASSANKKKLRGLESEKLREKKQKLANKTLRAPSQLRAEKDAVRAEKKKVISKKKRALEEADNDHVEHFDEQGYFVVPQQMKISNEDEAILENFHFDTKFAAALNDLVEQGIEERREADERDNMLSNPKVKLVYGDIAKLMKTYRSGKLARPLKIIPNLEPWEEVLQLTNPQEWSMQAWYAVTRCFASNLDVYRAKTFYEKYLTPKVIADVKAEKKLNYHLYQAVKKSLYKPQAWFKGVLFPIICRPDCTLREAQIIGSILSQTSIPSVYSSVAMLKLAEFDYTGPIGIILRVLIEKKYALPIRVINALVAFFLKFLDDPRVMPVIWHQLLLKFVELYQHSLSEEQRQKLKHLAKKKAHHQISPEVLNVLNKRVKSGTGIELE